MTLHRKTRGNQSNKREGEKQRQRKKRKQESPSHTQKGTEAGGQVPGPHSMSIPFCRIGVISFNYFSFLDKKKKKNGRVPEFVVRPSSSVAVREIDLRNDTCFVGLSFRIIKGNNRIIIKKTAMCVSQARGENTCILIYGYRDR